MVESAPTYPSLAGLLAGFQFAALSILLAGGKAKDTHTIGLFSAGLFTMGLDSFLFAQLSGLPKRLTGGLCRLGWGQAITAGGMLAVALAWFETISPDSNLANAARFSATVLVGTILPGLVIYLLSRSMGKDRPSLGRLTAGR